MKVKVILKETILLFINNFRSLIEIALPLSLAIAIVDYYSYEIERNTFLSYIYMLISTLIYFLLSSSLIIYLSQVIYDQEISPKTCIINGIIYVPYIFLVYLIIIAPPILFIKLLELVNQPELINIIFLPAVIFFLYFVIKSAFSSYFIVLEENKPITAIKNSFRYTKGFITTLIFTSLCFAGPISITQNLYEQITEHLPNKILLGSIGGICFNLLFITVHICMFKVFHTSFTYYNQQKNKD